MLGEDEEYEADDDPRRPLDVVYVVIDGRRVPAWDAARTAVSELSSEKLAELTEGYADAEPSSEEGRAAVRALLRGWIAEVRNSFELGNPGLLRLAVRDATCT